MADELVLYTNPMSRGRIARWMMEEIGQPYRAEILGFDASMKSADYKALNPMGKVPTLVHGDTVVTECAAICAYMADAFPQAGLAPEPNSQLRGPYYRWMFFAAGPVEAAVSTRPSAWKCRPTGRAPSATAPMPM
jgi:glutathione S-transferase